MLLVSRVKWPSNTQLLAIHVIFVTGFDLEFGIDLEFLLGASVAQWSECSPFTSEVAGSILSGNILNVAQTQC